jgi:hypothetical protein
MDWFEGPERWAGLRSFAPIECERTPGEESSYEWRFFISSLDGRDAKAIADASAATAGSKICSIGYRTRPAAWTPSECAGLTARKTSRARAQAGITIT